MAYDPHKLSMEKVASAFSPEDRIGALELQNLSVLDNRAFLIHHLESLRQLNPEREPLGELLALDDPDKTAELSRRYSRRSPERSGRRRARRSGAVGPDSLPA